MRDSRLAQAAREDSISVAKAVQAELHPEALQEPETKLEHIRATFADFAAKLDRSKAAQYLWERAVLLSKKEDDDKEAPKGFEKFFKKRGERKAAQTEQD